MAENFYGLTDTGKQRDNNEDAFFVLPVWANSCIAACVIDGVGGYEGGEVAAAIAKKTILHFLSQKRQDAITLMKQSFANAAKNIEQEKSKTGSNQQMACVLTMAIADAKTNQFYYAHVGDTRLYLFRDGGLIKITKDQSFVGMLEDTGRITEAAAMEHPKRNEIDKALGFSGEDYLADDYIETGASPFLPGDMLLLCSDGLTDLVTAAQMQNILSENNSLEQKTTALIDAANAAGGKDNITAVLVQNTKTPIKQKAKKPLLLKKQITQPVQMQSENEEQIKPVQIVKAKPLLKSNRNQIAVIFLSLLCLVLMGGLGYLIWKQYKGEAAEKANSPRQKNGGELRLQNLINATTGDTLHLSIADFGKEIIITDTIFVQRDSLYITGNVALVKDSSFAEGGPAIFITQQCKWIVIDGIEMRHFSVGILCANKNALQIKNGNFINCTISLAYIGGATDFIHGMFINTRNRTTDSLSNQNQQ